MLYSISRNSLTSQFIQVRLELACKAGEKICLQLPSWRPGRYEMANYAQKIKSFNILFKEKEISWEKETKSLWRFHASEEGQYQVFYEFYCNQMDAGACWSDDQQLYLNFSNFFFDIKGREKEEIHIHIDLPENYRVATALEKTDTPHSWKAGNFQEVMDSPLIASPQLSHYNYSVDGILFHLWIQGEIHFETSPLIAQFKDFTGKMMRDFGEFPENEYHFLFQLLPYKHYHGVEHARSTVITFGPALSLSDKKEMDELIGVSAHELYHAWNVCRIRPKELIPYDLSKEVYLDTGLVLEGVTTYMGDLYLLKSGYFTLEDYCSLLSKIIQREFDSLGWENQSIVESSFDLWLDGYKPGIPDKKVSIYNRGALLSFCLDVLLLEKGSSLAEVMKTMWEDFGKTKTGYTLSDFEQIIAQAYGDRSRIRQFFKDHAEGKKDLLPLLSSCLDALGLELTEIFDGSPLLHNYGIRTTETGTITQIHAKSPAYSLLMLNDQLVRVQGKVFSPGESHQYSGDLEIVLERYGREVHVKLPQGAFRMFPSYGVCPRKPSLIQKKWMA